MTWSVSCPASQAERAGWRPRSTTIKRYAVRRRRGRGGTTIRSTARSTCCTSSGASVSEQAGGGVSGDGGGELSFEDGGFVGVGVDDGVIDRVARQHHQRVRGVLGH